MPSSKPRYDRILVATDLSENARRAFSYAAGLADAVTGRITVLHVVEKLPPNAELLLAAFLGYRNLDELRSKSDSELVAQIKARLEDFCAETAANIPECRIIFEKVIVEPGRAAERILHHATTRNFGTLVMGCRGHGRIQAAILGSTSEKVIRQCPIPVLLVPC